MQCNVSPFHLVLSKLQTKANRSSVSLSSLPRAPGTEESKAKVKKNGWEHSLKASKGGGGLFFYKVRIGSVFT